jgi:uncharacterized protein YndB with AHSA1/START domain
MRHFENRLHLDGPIERVFDLAIDPDYWAEYIPWVSDIRDVRGRGDQVGDSARYTDHAVARTVSATTTVTEVERPVLQTTDTVYDDGSRMVMTMRFTIAGKGTDIATTADYELGKGWLAGAIETVTAGIVERRMRDMGKNFARVLAAIPR